MHPPRRRQIPNAPPGDDWFEPAGGTRFDKEEYVRINKGGPNFERYAQVLQIWAKSDEAVLYTVITIDNEEQVVLEGLESFEIVPAELNAMEILALQADPNFRERGKEGS
jgi:hypothetical protein